MRTPQYVLLDINGDTDVKYDILIDSNEQTGIISADAWSKLEKKDQQRYREIKDSNDTSVYFVSNPTTFGQLFIEWVLASKYTWRVVKLPTFDYLINRGNGLAIEMKDVTDFISSWLEKPQENTGETRIISQLKRAISEETLSLDIPRCLIIRDGLQLRMIHETHFDIEAKQKEIWRIEYSPVPEKYITVDSEENGKKATIRQDNCKHSWQEIRLHPNAFIGFILATQRFMPVVMLGGIEHSLDFFRLQIDKAIKGESEAEKIRKALKTISRNDTAMEDWKRQLQVVQTSVPGLGTIHANNILLEKGSIRNLFASPLTESDWMCCTSRKDSILDEKTKKIAEEFERLATLTYVPLKKDEKKA